MQQGYLFQEKFDTFFLNYAECKKKRNGLIKSCVTQAMQLSEETGPKLSTPVHVSCSFYWEMLQYGEHMKVDEQHSL